jgi:hypothetical protein
MFANQQNVLIFDMESTHDNQYVRTLPLGLELFFMDCLRYTCLDMRKKSEIKLILRNGVRDLTLESQG